VSVGLSRK